MMNTDGFGKTARKLPVTMTAIVAIAMGFFACWLTIADGTLVRLLGLGAKAPDPWQFLTYFVAFIPSSSAFIGVIFSALWLYMIGQTLEPSVGTRRYALVMLGMILLGSVMYWLGCTVADYPGFLAGSYLPVAYLSVLWAALNPNSPVRFMFFIPLTAKILALIVGGMVLFGYGSESPLVGVITVLPMIALWFGADMVLGNRKVSGKSAAERRQEQREFNQFIDKVRDREKEREERERLRKLFEDSLDDK